MGQEMANLSEMRQNLRPIQKDLRTIGLKRYLMIAFEFSNFDTVSISILRRWRGLTEARVAQVVNLLIELGHLLKLIAFQSVTDVNSTPLVVQNTSPAFSEMVLPTGLVTCSLYKDENIAIGEVPVTSALYDCGIRKPLVYVCTSSVHQNLVMGILGEPPPRETIPQLKASLQAFLGLFETGALERVGVPISSLLLQGDDNGNFLRGGS